MAYIFEIFYWSYRHPISNHKYLKFPNIYVFSKVVSQFTFSKWTRCRRMAYRLSMRTDPKYRLRQSCRSPRQDSTNGSRTMKSKSFDLSSRMRPNRNSTTTNSVSYSWSLISIWAMMTMIRCLQKSTRTVIRILIGMNSYHIWFLVFVRMIHTTRRRLWSIQFHLHRKSRSRDIAIRL